MFSAFLKFELAYRLKGLMVWIFLAVITAIMLVVLLTEEPAMEDLFFSNSFRNSPFVIFRLYGLAAVFGCLMVTAFVNSAASRDFTCRTDQLIFTKPISKSGFLMGRFLGAMLISLLPMLGCSLAVLIAPMFLDGSQCGPISWSAHAWSVLVFALPNTFFISSIIFAIAIWTRSALASFLGILALMVALTISNALLTALASENLAAIADPFGDTALATMTKYWTIAEKNTDNPGFNGLLLWNRLLWSSIGLVVLVAACLRFSFSGRAGWLGQLIGLIKSSIDESISTSLLAPPSHEGDMPVAKRQFNRRAKIRQLIHMTGVELWDTIKSPIFICLIFGVLLTVIATLSVEAGEALGLSSLPVTFKLTESIAAALAEIQLVLITFFAGVFVWKERDANLDEVFDALPFPSWIAFASKLLALFAIVAFVFVIGIVSGILFQLGSGFTSIHLGVYGSNLLALGLLQLSSWVVLAVLCHAVSPNKYVGYVVFIGLLVINAVAWPLLEIESTMVRFGSLPPHKYSDMFQLKPYAAALGWFALYWGLLTAILSTVTVLFWQRGRESGLINRLNLAIASWSGGLRWALVGLLLTWTVVGTWVLWNTQIVNSPISKREKKSTQVAYESSYRHLENQPQPRVSTIRYDIDLFPRERRLNMCGKQTLVNRTENPIETIYVTTFDPFETEVSIVGARLEASDEELNLLTYRLDTPLQPAATCELEFSLTYTAEGFEDSLQVPQIVQNGTFFNNLISPQVGYVPSIELLDSSERKKFGLSGSSFQSLDSENIMARRNHYLSNCSDWVDVETVISTSADQIAVAPGSLIKHWKTGNRNYFQYKLDHRSLNFYSFVSARYKVETRRWKDVDVEVYYHPEHQWNVNLMLQSIRKSLEYYTAAFGPYRHKQARIIEFPRVEAFAQAFPGSMPYSEGIGFIADLKNKDDIDMVFYVVAHEMAHQWWAHQVIGANMEGATLLSETLAQYSALMVMEKEYGRDMMRKFLKHEMDNYLRFRGSDDEPEVPLQNVGPTQGYIHYNKGSVAMYHLKETIGEDRLNAALRTLVDRFAYSEGPYPTSIDLIDALRAKTPPEHHGVLEDLFEKITLFENRTVSAGFEPLPDGKYRVTLDLEFKKLHAGPDGSESESPLDDWIEIGAFAKPEFGREFGSTLHRQRLHITKPKSTHQFVVDQQPHLAGIDPFSLLIDRNTADNMKTPVEALEKDSLRESK